MKLPENLIILEMANNHMGSLEHGKRIISDFSVLIKLFPKFNFSFKLQYRDLPTFIRPDYVGRSDIAHVKRFEQTKLSRIEQKKLVEHIKSCGFLAMCTPFDNASIAHVVEDKFDIIKVASCSFGDWPLLEDLSATNLPIVASTAGAPLDLIDDVIAFLQNREKDFIIQHCVGEYPTPLEHMNLNQIDFLKARHPEVRFGFSTHEDPSDVDLVKLAVAKGAVSFEKHVGVPTPQWPLNAYSSTLEQAEAWLRSAQDALTACGVMGERYTSSKEEKKSLISLQRGAFASKNSTAGDVLATEDVKFAFPPSDGQLGAHSFSKYAEITLVRDVKAGDPILIKDVKVTSKKDTLKAFAYKVAHLLKKSQVALPHKFTLELSHHYGLNKFEEYGLSMITLVNREYCKKVLVCLPGQVHPEQYHKVKEETFRIVYGELAVKIDGVERMMKPGDIHTILPGQRHMFVSTDGAVIEEVSSTHVASDSYYTDPSIMLNKERKSFVTWLRQFQE